MSEKTIAPYGSWKSPITIDMVVRSPNAWISSLYTENGILYATRNRIEEGRGTIARFNADGSSEDIIPKPYYVRTQVYEYGGACYVVKDGVVYFSNFPDNRLYRCAPGEDPHPITAEGEHMRYADFVVDHQRNRLIGIREDYSAGDEPAHTITAIDMNGDEFGTVLFDQTDFVAFPSISPDGKKLAWVGWNHPHMPFYTSSLWAADIQEDGTLTNVQEVVAGDEESITDPCWSPDGTLYFCSDRSNWWNLHRWRDGKIEHVLDEEAELGNPYWNIGLRIYRFLSPSRAVACQNRNGAWELIDINVDDGTFEVIPTPFTFMIRMELVGTDLYMVAASQTVPRSLIKVDLNTREYEIIENSVKYDLSDDYISPGEHIAYPTENGLMAYGYYHPPKNPEFEAPEGTAPPLIVNVHGGPTGSTKNALDMDVQRFTSRGFAVLNINYGGSAGYGREYRNRLRGQWGVVDVEDAVNGAKYLVEQGLADKDKTVVRGMSAGGFATFAALAFKDYFKAGSSLFGISDVEVFHKETHKYESRYCETLVGPYPERKDLYRERSAMSKVDQINVPLAIFQGSDDKVVPPNQSQFVRDALTERGVPVVYLEFEGEAHGFRKLESIRAFADTEMAFFGKVFGFEPADDLPEIEIINFPTA